MAMTDRRTFIQAAAALPMTAAAGTAFEPASAMEDPQEPALAVSHARRHQPGRPRHTQSYLRGRRSSGRYRFGDTPQSSPRICDTVA